MPGTLQVGGNDVFIHTGDAGAGTVVLQNTQLQAAATVASYAWNVFYPPDLDGTIGNGSNGGTVTGNDYLTFSNSSGTLTFTCLVAGKYKFSTNYSVNHSNVYNYDTFYLNLGGTATRNTVLTNVSIFGPSQSNGNMLGSWGFLATATANQTVTILPQYRLQVGSGNTGQHNVFVNTDIIYCGS